ncbi:sideroflexin-1-like [Athalia rosae]|uniref:sideroflexin-1-like n=1 Tax=Athalia rosae TaxID=37344 RepID=UPI0020344747|nr:sideroflexin-1-like [Athalia rosae]
MAKIDIEKPRWDQSTYSGRARHFFAATNPLNLLATSSDLENARIIVANHRNGVEQVLSEDELWRAKYLYDGAFHPDTGEKMFLPGRMSAQVPVNMFITGMMMTYYKRRSRIIFWQWFNQSFNALVNYTNRSGSSTVPLSTLAMSYVVATTAALLTALKLNSMVKSLSPLAGRLVPFASVVAANCINVPLMRVTEIRDGIELRDGDGKLVGRSRRFAIVAIYSVAASRILMAAPSMLSSPLLMNYLDKRGALRRHPRYAAPLQVLWCGICLTFATPLACALFSQRASVPVGYLGEKVEREVRRNTNSDIVYYNKGL